MQFDNVTTMCGYSYLNIVNKFDFFYYLEENVRTGQNCNTLFFP